MSQIIDRVYPQSLFRVTIQPGVNVVDTFKNTIYRTPAETGDGAPTTAVAPPIRAEAAPDWSSRGSLVAVVLGVALLATALVVFARRAWRRTPSRGA